MYIETKSNVEVTADEIKRLVKEDLLFENRRIPSFDEIKQAQEKSIEIIKNGEILIVGKRAFKLKK